MQMRCRWVDKRQVIYKRRIYMYNELRKMGYKPMSERSKMRFRCDGCGECCKNREDIILNGYDVVRLRKKLDITLEELIQKYAEVYIGPSSKMPLIRLLPVGEEKRCPFLFFNKCIVHEAKPTICGLFPLGKAYTEKTEVQYFLQDVPCGERDNTQTVGEWVSDMAQSNFYTLHQYRIIPYYQIDMKKKNSILASSSPMLRAAGFWPTPFAA